MHKSFRILLGCLAIALSLGATPVWASDYPFGADGIPYLAREVQDNEGIIVVVERLEPRPTPGNAVASLYLGQVAEVVYPRELPGPLKQAVQPRGQVRIAVLRETVHRDTPARGKSIAFLYPPLDAQKAARYGVAGDGNALVFLSVNGHFGIVPATESSRLEAIQAYLHATSEERLGWSRRYFESQDLLLQRSALLETTIQPYAGKRVLDLCNEALKSNRVLPKNKEVVVTALQYSKAESALDPLRRLVLDDDAPLPLRTSALRAMMSVPGGVRELNEFKDKGNSPWLRSKSQEFLKPLDPGSDNQSSPPSREQIISKLKSGKSDERRKALEATGIVAYSKELGDALKTLVRDAKEQYAVRELAAERLAAYNNRSAAEALAEIAKDTSLPKELRASAIMAIARIETGINKTILRNLAGSLSEVELKELAKGLVDR